MNPTGAGPTNSTEFVELALPPLVAARYNDLITFDLGKLLRRLLRLESILGYMIEESEQWIDDMISCRFLWRLVSMCAFNTSLFIFAYQHVCCTYIVVKSGINLFFFFLQKKVEAFHIS